MLTFLISPMCFAEILQDEFANTYLKDAMPAYTHTKYDYTNTDIVPIKLCIAKDIKSEAELHEGQEVEFRILRHVVYNNKIIAKRGQVVPARVKIIVTAGMNGIPASIIFDNFKIKGIEPGQLADTYEVFGQDRSLILYPIKWALTILPPSGTLTNFIKGGHAKLKTSKTVIIYYHPRWI